jgi:hypothetical protein
MSSSAKLKNFHIPMTDDLYSELKKAANNLGQPATKVARNVIEEWLHHRKKNALHRDIAAYAREHAESNEDFDPFLEEAAAEHLWKAAENNHIPIKKRSRK